MEKVLPVYKLVLRADNELNTGVEFVSLVDEPAIDITWQAFSAHAPAANRYSFKTADAEKRIISGPLMVADMPIYRKDAIGEYYAVFDAPTIAQVVQRFFRNGYTGNVNQMHNDAARIEDVYMIESFLIDSKRGINTPLGFPALSDGSWFGSYKVDNDAVWQNYIKTGIFRGFSIEGLFSRQVTDISLPCDETEAWLIDEIMRAVSDTE